MKKFLLAFIIILAFMKVATAQRAGEIQGRVLNEKGEGIPFANVVVFRNDIQVMGTATDFEGFFSLKPLEPGKYKLIASYLGKNVEVNNISVGASKTTFLKDIVISTAQTLNTVTVKYEEPPVDVGKPETGDSKDREEIERMPKNNLAGIIGNTAMTYQGDDDELISIAGSRGYGTKYLIDGVDLTGIVDLPNDAVDRVEILTGGVDASQGDFTGGVVNVSTRGPSNALHGSAEYLTSQYLDPFGYSEGRFSLLGPITKQFAGTDSARTNLGFLISGKFIYEKESDPPGIPIYYVNDSKLEELKANPLVSSRTGEGFNKATEFIYKEDLVSSYVRKNNDDWQANFFGKLDYKPSLTTNLTFGANYFHSNNNANIRVFEMFNSENNPKVYSDDLRLYTKFTQRFRTAEKEETSGYSISSAYYTIQINYQYNQDIVEDRNHRRNPFEYGYIGKFNTLREPVYFYADDSVTGKQAFKLFGYRDTAVTFVPGTANPVLSRYTEQYYDVYDPASLTDVVLGGGLRNGDFTQSLYSYSMWYNPGVPYTNYNNSDNTQFGGRFDASVDLKKSTKDQINKHSIEFGFEYEQRVERSYSVSPYGLWGLARQATNFHLNNLDVANPYYLVNGDTIHYTQYQGEVGEFDSIFYYRRYDQQDQTYFDIKLREKLGIPINSLEYINLDNIDPELLSLDMFSPDQLINGGNRVVSTRGYDYYGNKLSQAPSFADFFYDYVDNNGNGQFDFGDYYTRNLDAYRPIYTGAYIQDRFNIGRVLFRVGLRVDRFDANQKVLRDQYSLYPIRTVEEVTTINGNTVNHPSTVGNNFAVYVDDKNNPSRILGYRDGNTWYNAEGTQITDPGVIANQTTTGVIAPYLVDPTANIKDPDNFDVDASFQDYNPQFTVMPRIAFSFPITETAMFTAHYDVLTQRPISRNEATPYHYYYLEELAIDGVIPNPNLKPEKTINYQLGFQQALSDKSALKISAYYREMRDMMQVTRILYAYPTDYTTYGNVDFGTVKGLTIKYDLIRRVKNIRFTGAYTLQFASGTGSNTTSQLGLINAGQPNLRTIVPLNNDVRHQFLLDLDYRFASGKDYDGPRVNGKPIFENAGLLIQMRARTGEPYTRQSNPTPTAMFGVASRSTLLGSINGSRLPFNFKVDLAMDKDIAISGGKKPMFVNVYLKVQNLLNSRIVRGVYRYTGSPSDDGYLSSPLAQEVISAQVDQRAFMDQYTIKMMNPGNYALPRRVQLGVKLKF